MTTHIVPTGFRYIKFLRAASASAVAEAPEVAAAAAAAEAAEAARPIPVAKKLQSKADEKEQQIWDHISGFLREHEAVFIQYPYKRCNLRFVVDQECEPLLQRLHNIRIPYLAGRDKLDIELFYYYIIGSGHDFYYAVIDDQEVARPVWEQRLFEPKD